MYVISIQLAPFYSPTHESIIVYRHMIKYNSNRKWYFMHVHKKKAKRLRNSVFKLLSYVIIFTCAFFLSSSKSLSAMVPPSLFIWSCLYWSTVWLSTECLGHLLQDSASDLHSFPWNLPAEQMLICCFPILDESFFSCFQEFLFQQSDYIFKAWFYFNLF